MTERTDSIMVNIPKKHPLCVVINGDSRKHTRPSFIGIMESIVLYSVVSIGVLCTIHNILLLASDAEFHSSRVFST
jgi:hypothetical protein